jgi:hypothetical protein
MGVKAAVPSQLEAVVYLEAVAKQTWGPLVILGHSKGGNLAVYAASFCSAKVRRRIAILYCDDGPGFHKSVLESPGYQEIRGRVKYYVPDESIIGMLFEHENQEVIKSDESGIAQHDLYTWQLTRDDIEKVESLSRQSRFFDQTFRQWLGNLDYSQRSHFIEALYSILNATEATTFKELGDNWLKSAGKMLGAIKNTDKKSREMLGKVVSALLKAAGSNIPTLFQ